MQYIGSPFAIDYEGECIMIPEVGDLVKYAEEEGEIEYIQDGKALVYWYHANGAPSGNDWYDLDRFIDRGNMWELED